MFLFASGSSSFDCVNLALTVHSVSLFVQFVSSLSLAALVTRTFLGLAQGVLCVVFQRCLLGITWQLKARLRSLSSHARGLRKGTVVERLSAQSLLCVDLSFRMAAPLYRIREMIEGFFWVLS